MKTQTFDFLVETFGKTTVLSPLTERAKNWCIDLVKYDAEPALMWGNGYLLNQASYKWFKTEAAPNEAFTMKVAA